MIKAKQTITLTFGDVCENHVGMEQVGTLQENGLSIEQLEKIAKKFPKENVEFINLNTSDEQDPAVVLIVRNGLSLMMDDEDDEKGFIEEQTSLEPDKKAYMRGRVVNKRARYNLCFSEEGHPPDYENGKGTVISFDEVPYLFSLKEGLEEIFEVENLQCEGNYYYDTTSRDVGIGRHGDTERRIVIGVRLGETMPIEWTWYFRFTPVSKNIRINLNHGDIYAMSSKAVGFDWKKSSIQTLRHSAGSEAFLEKEGKRCDSKVLNPMK